MTSHPSPFRSRTVSAIQQYLPPQDYPRVLDPFAGIGMIHLLKQETVGVELEPEWGTQHPDTIIGNALHLPFADCTFPAIATSPTFGNRMADHHNAKDTSKRNTYKHRLGRDLSPDSSAVMPWGPEYREFHTKAWAETTRVASLDARFVLHVKNHIRKGGEIHVSEWHMNTLFQMGWSLTHMDIISVRGLRHGANRDLRTNHEYLIVFDRKGTIV